MTPKITIIIPVYNSEKSINKCIDSLLSQTIKDINIIIVNDGSTDKTLTKLSKYKYNKNIKILFQKHCGTSKARNYALNYVTTQYVTFVDADDYVDKCYIQHLVSGFTNNSIDLVATGANIVNPQGQILFSINPRSKVITSNIMISEILKENGIQGYLWNKIFKFSIIKDYNLKFDENISMAEDLMFCVNYLLISKNVKILAYKDYFYVQNPKSLSKKATLYNTNKNYKQAYINYLAAFLKIKEIIPANLVNSYINVSARIVRTAEDFLRVMYLNRNIISVDTKLKLKLKNIIKENINYFFKSNIISNKKKLYFILFMLCPSLVYKIDKQRFR